MSPSTIAGCPLPTAPAISIAGRAWPIPPLVPRQNRIIVPLLVAGCRDYAGMLDIVFSALTRAHPHLVRDEFEEWPIATRELIEAIPIIAQQTGLMRAGHRNTKAEAPNWDAIIAQFVNFLPGTTPDYWEDALTISRLEAMREEWRLHPPVAVLVAGYLGYRPKPRNLEAVEELVRLFPTGNLKLN